MKLYVSITSIYDKQKCLLKSLESIKRQTLLPNKCYIYLSEEPYLLDKGFTSKIITDVYLNTFLTSNTDLFEVVWVKNTGPYRKLLPLLKEKWNEDCLIITMDDDTVYQNNLIQRLKDDYIKHKCSINYRGFTLNVDNGLEKIVYTDTTKYIQKHLYNFATGKGGVLYHPNFFKKTHNLIFNENLIEECSKTTDDIWFNFLRMANNIELYIQDRHSNDSVYMVTDLSVDSLALCTQYNFKKINNESVNDININKTVVALKKLNLLDNKMQSFDSTKYWELRYRNGGNSGDGSYNHLAKFKADVINNFISEKKIDTLIDYGMGDGNQLQFFNVQNYIGIDVSATSINKCREKYMNDKTKQFYLVDDYLKNKKHNVQLAISCDVLYHLIDESIFNSYLDTLLSLSCKFVIIYARDENRNHTEHVKFRKFTDIIEKKYPQWKLIKHIPNKYPQVQIGHNNQNTSPSDFYIYELV